MIIIKGILKNLQIFGTITFLATSPININHETADQAYIYKTTIEYTSSIEDLEDYVLQGICRMDDKYLVTAYNAEKTNNSIIYILDENCNHIDTKKLDTQAHVGGIAYDERNQNIWITDTNGKVNVYNKNEITNPSKRTAKAKSSIYLGEQMENSYGIESIAYITIKDDKLFIGNYNDDKHTILKQYQIRDNGTIDKKSVKTSHLTGNIQGINFYEKDGETYLITSASFGRYFNSELKIYKYDNDEVDYRGKEIGSFYTPPMMEEMEIVDGQLITVYESNAKKYQTLVNRYNNDFVISDIDDIINKSKTEELIKIYSSVDIGTLYEDKRKAI